MHGWGEAALSLDVLQPLRLSLFVALCSTAVVAVAGTALAYALARKSFAGRTALDLLVTMPLILPPTVTGYYLILLFGRRGLLGAPLYQATGLTITFTVTACVIAAAVMSLPLMVKTAQAAIESVDREYEDVARTLGSPEWQIALRVTLPLARKGIVAGLVLAFGRALGEFGATLMLAGNIPGRTTTMPLAIYSAVATGEDAAARWLVVLLTAVSAAVLLTARRLGKTPW